MIDASKLRGPGVKRREAHCIVAQAHRALWKRECPYTKNTHKWSIWMTAYRNPGVTNEKLFEALQASGVKCNE